jgi:hypothetical protein
MTGREMNAMLWFSGRWWWFPGARIAADLEFEWRDNRLYLLERYGSAVEGIVFAGEVDPD